MKLLLKVIGALAVVAISFVTTLWFLDRNAAACPAGRAIPLERPFAKYTGSGFAYSRELTGVDIPSDTVTEATRSRLVLCEDDSLLETAHSQHAAIDKQGRGRYSHWGNTMIFSASDNTDPNINGRSYMAVLPR